MLRKQLCNHNSPIKNMTNSKIEISATLIIKILLISGGILTLMTIGSGLLLPLMVAIIIAVLLDKPINKLTKWGIPNIWAIFISVSLMVVLFVLLSWLIGSQLNKMAEDWPELKEKGTQKLNQLSEWANSNLNWDYKDYMNNNSKIISRVESLAGSVLKSLINVLSQSFIIFIYIIVLLMQKKMFINFFRMIASDSEAMTSLLSEASKNIRNYLVGKGKIMFFLFVIYYIGFLLSSVPYALFLALFAALFSIIPYVGNLIGGGIALILSFLYAGATSALIVVAVISVAQLIENYILTPWIIGDETDLNPFITIFGVIVLSTIWGAVGAIIALPLIAVLKVIFEHTKGMEAYAYLLNKKQE